MTTNPKRATLPLLTWLSPAFPVGAFAYSHGLEWAVECGDVDDADTLGAWIGDLVAHGAIRADVVLLAAGWRAAGPSELMVLNDLALALAPSSERFLETRTQGAAFLLAIVDAWPAPSVLYLAEMLGTRDIAYPLAVAAAAGAHELPLYETLEAYVAAAVGNLVSAALRLGPVGQSEAQRIIARQQPALARLAAWAETSGLDDLGTCAWRADIASMRHETQYSRLFRS